MANDDDFEDDTDAYEDADDLGGAEGEGSEENWDSYDEPSDDSPADDGAPTNKPPKKKSGLFNLLLIGGAVAAIGGTGVVVLGKGKPAAPAAQQGAAQQSADSAKDGMLGGLAEAQKMQEVIARHKGAAATGKAPENISAANPLASAPVETATLKPKDVPAAAAPPMPTPIGQPETVSSNPPQPTPSPLSGGAPEISKSAPVAPGSADALHMPKAQDVLLKSAPTPEPAVNEVSQEPKPLPVAAPSVDSALSGKVDEISGRLAKLEARMSSMKEDSSGDRLSALQSSVAALQEQVSALSAALKQRPSATAVEKPKPAESARPSGGSKRETKSVPEPRPSPVVLGEKQEAAPAQHLAAPVPKPEIKGGAPSAGQTPSVKWVLRGAQPGQAMLARDGESDVRTVGVGDTVPGLGKIISISYKEGHWVVQGALGAVSR